MSRTRILLADDHAIVRDGLVRLLETEFDVVGAVGDGQSLVAEAQRLQPDVIICDIGMPGFNGLEAALRLADVAPDSKVIFLTQHSGSEYIQAAFRLRVRAYVLKNSAAAELLTAVRGVMDGRYYVSEQLREHLQLGALEAGQNPADLMSHALTPRQTEVLRLVAVGRTAKEIAFELGISVKTVDFHKSSIMDALGLRTTAELTRYAIEQGIVQR